MDLKRLAREKGTNLKRLAEQCEIPPSTLYAISRGDTNFGNVGIDTAIKVAAALGMTVEELYTGKKPEASEAHPNVSENERELIALYRSMSARGRDLLIENAEFLATRYPLNKANSLGA